MSQSGLTDISKNLTLYQKGKLLSLLRALSDEFRLVQEKDLGATQGRKRLIHFSGKKLKALLTLTDSDRNFLKKLLNLLEEESVLIPTGVISVPSNEKEEEIYGHPISVLLPANFEECKQSYERKLEEHYQETIRASMPIRTRTAPPRRNREVYDLDLFSILLNLLVKIIGTPLILLYTLGKDVASFTYKFLLIPLLAGAVLLWVTGTWNAFIDWLAIITS